MSLLLNKNKFFAIELTENNEVVVNSSDGNTVISTNPSTESKVTIGIADEQVKLYNGKILKRIKNNLIIE